MKDNQESTDQNMNANVHDFTKYDDHDRTYDGFASNEDRCLCAQSHDCDQEPSHKVITDNKNSHGTVTKEIDYVCDQHVEMVVEAEKEAAQ